MRTRILTALLGFTLLWLAACSQEEPIPTSTPEPTALNTAVPTVTLETSTATPTPTPLPTLTPSATPVIPEISAQTQVVYDNQELLINAVTAPEDGWLAVYKASQASLSSADLLGVIPIEMGDSVELIIEIDAAKATETLQIALHGGRTEAAAELDPAGSPLLLIETVNVELQILRPVIETSDQEVFEDGLLLINSVNTAQGGWIGIHNNLNGERGELLGFAAVDAGINRDTPITIRWRNAHPSLLAVLYEDAGEPRTFEYDAADQPISYNGEIVATTFEITLPMEIVIFDQPVVDGEFYVKRVVSNGPGWLVVYQDSADISQGFIIGTVALEDGLNEDVLVEVDSTAVTPIIQLTIHDDTTAGDQFDFPGNDPRRDYLGRARFFPFSTETGSYVIVRDQPLTAANEITIATVAAEADLWLIAHADDNGLPGEVIGEWLIDAGYHEDIVITLNQSVGPNTQLHLMLHSELDENTTFDPEVDLPLLQRGLPILVPFLVVEN